MDLRDALTQISEIRAQVARTQVYRGYRSAPVAASGLIAFGAGWVQSAWIGDPAGHLGAYLTLWIGAALLSGVAAGVGMAVGRCRPGSTWPAVEPLVPSLVAGGLIAGTIAATAPEASWMLPGLWQAVFALGIFASGRVLPRATAAVGAFYLVAGAACLVLARGASALSPWAMAVPFGIGQFAAAAILYWTLERGDGQG